MRNVRNKSNSFSEYQNLLIEAEELHQSALKITIDAFGEVNVQTAKHYGNLGRLYQSMGKYQVCMISNVCSCTFHHQMNLIVFFHFHNPI